MNFGPPLSFLQFPILRIFHLPTVFSRFFSSFSHESKQYHQSGGRGVRHARTIPEAGRPCVFTAPCPEGAHAAQFVRHRRHSSQPVWRLRKLSLHRRRVEFWGTRLVKLIRFLTGGRLIKVKIIATRFCCCFAVVLISIIGRISYKSYYWPHAWRVLTLWLPCFLAFFSLPPYFFLFIPQPSLLSSIYCYHDFHFTMLLSFLRYYWSSFILTCTIMVRSTLFTIGPDHSCNSYCAINTFHCYYTFSCSIVESVCVQSVVPMNWFVCIFRHHPHRH